MLFQNLFRARFKSDLSLLEGLDLWRSDLHIYNHQEDIEVDVIVGTFLISISYFESKNLFPSCYRLDIYPPNISEIE